MALKIETIFGGVAAVVGVASLYFLSRNNGSSGNVTVNNIPALQTPSSSQAPEEDNYVPAAYYASTPVIPDVIAQTRGDQATRAYQQENFGPSHVYHKAVVRTAEQQAQRVADTCTADCCSGCSGQSKCPSNSKPVRTQSQSKSNINRQVNNMHSVVNLPRVESSNRNNYQLDSTIQQYNNALYQNGQAVLLNNQNAEGWPANVPSATTDSSTPVLSRPFPIVAANGLSVLGVHDEHQFSEGYY